MDAVASALAYLNTRFENPDRLTGIYAVTIRGPAPLTRVIALTETGLVEATGDPEAADARIAVDQELLLSMLRTRRAIDVRRPEARGKFESSGRHDLVDLLRGMMSETPPENRELLAGIDRAAEGRAPLDVVRVRGDRCEDVRAAYLSGAPLVVEDAVMPITPSELAARFPSEEAVATATGGTKTIAELVGEMERAAIYSNGFALSDVLRAAFPPPLFDASFFHAYAQLWLGRAASNTTPLTRLHRDCAPSFLAQLAGTKRVLLYPPEQSAFLYPSKNWIGVQRATVRPSAPDLDRYPEFAHARAQVVDLQPGEVLVIPTGFWHEMYAIGGPVLSISYGCPPDAQPTRGA